MSETLKYDYSFVVPAFNEESHLDFTLKALQKCMEGAKGHRGEIVVVDNNSDDRTAEIAKARGVRVVFEPHNQISKARNRGASQSKGENLFFVDADTIVSPSLFLEALSLMKRGACGGGGGVVVLRPQGRRLVLGALRSFFVEQVVRNFPACRRKLSFLPS